MQADQQVHADPGSTAAGSPKTKRRWRYSLSTLLFVVTGFGVLFALVRPAPPTVLISRHGITFPPEMQPQRKAASQELYTLLQQNKLVGRRAIDLPLYYAIQIDIRADRIEYHVAIDELFSAVIVVVDARTGLVIAARVRIDVYYAY